MKIAFLSYYSGSSPRGVETYVHELANRLVSLKHEVDVFQGGPVLPQALYRTRPLSSVSSLGQLAPDTDWVVPTNGRFQTLLASVWTKRFHKKLLISGQSGLGLDDRVNLYAFPSVFVALTQAQSAWAHQTNPRVEIVTIPNGVDTHHFSPNTKPLKHSLHQPVVLTVGALVPIKRHELIIRTVAQLPETSLLIVGDGPDRSRLTHLADQLLPGRYSIISLSHSDMPAVYTSADVFVYACEPFESFGIAMVEALASNLPIVSTPDPIRKEIVGNAGLLASSSTPESLSSSITSALTTQWGSLPRQQALQFDWDKIALQYHNLFTRYG